MSELPLALRELTVFWDDLNVEVLWSRAIQPTGSAKKENKKSGADARLSLPSLSEKKKKRNPASFLRMGRLSFLLKA